MADTFTDRLRLRLQQTGANRNVWGSLLNAAAIQLLDDSVCGLVEITVAGADVTLSTANGATDQARMAMLRLIGSPGATRSIIVPGKSKHYLVINNTDAAQTVKVSGSTGVAVPAGSRQAVFCDGTDVFAVQATTLGTVANAELLDGLDSTAFWRIASFNQSTRGNATSFVTLVDGGTITADCTLSNKFDVVLGGNRTLVLSNPGDGQSIEIWFQQDGTGGRTITWPANVRFSSDSSDDLTADANAIDVFTLTYNSTLDLWVAERLSNASAGDTVNLSIASGTHLNLSVFELAGSPGGVVTVNFTLEAGVRVFSSTTGAPALDFAGFASGSTINFINRGKVMGRGGRGGRGGSAREGEAGAGTTLNAGQPGRAGGTAVRGPGTGITFNINNGSGFIWGGGGGGGGGGATVDNTTDASANGGGGGGGAGGGEGADGGSEQVSTSTTPAVGVAGTNGSYEDATANGTGGAATATASATGGTGGAGGDWGTVGTGGTAQTGRDFDASAGAAGAAGLAVDQNGGVATFGSGSGSPNVKGAVT
jgi:hypothetical protein